MNRLYIFILLACTVGTGARSQQDMKLSLKDAIALALRNNPQMHASRSRVDAERGRFWKGVSLPSPSLSIEYNYIPQQSPISQYGERIIALNQSFDFPSTIALRGSYHNSQIDLKEAELTVSSIEIATNVKIAYFSALTKKQKRIYAEENLTIAEDFAHKAEIRSNLGEGTNLEMLTAKVQFTQARNALESSRNELMIALNELYLALGRNGDQQKEIQLSDSLIFTPTTNTIEYFISRSTESNPHIKALSHKVSTASIQQAIAWSSLLPTFNFSYARQNQTGNNEEYGIAFGISLPLWFAFDQRGQIQEASAELASVESELQSIHNAVRNNVRNTFLDMQNNERQVLLYQTDLLPQAEEIYRTAFASYDAGELTYLEFLQAKQTLISVKNSYVDMLFNLHVSRARLDQAIGNIYGE